MDAAGEPLLAVHATKGKTRYRYYVSRGLHTGTASTGMRLPARELELAVTARLTKLFADPLALIGTCWLQLHSSEVGTVMARCADVALSPAAPHRATVCALVERVTIHRDQVEITCSSAAIAELLQVPQNGDAPATITIRSDVTLTRSGTALRLVQAGGSTSDGSPNQALVRLILRARRWWDILRQGEMDITQLAANEGLQNGYVTRVLRLAFLAPQVTDAILTGTLRAGIDGGALTATGAIPPLGCPGGNDAAEVDRSLDQSATSTAWVTVMLGRAAARSRAAIPNALENTPNLHQGELVFVVEAGPTGAAIR